MDAGVRLECSDCGSTLGLRGDDWNYLRRARSFVAAHQLCEPRSVMVHVAEVEAATVLRLVSAG
ncbi:MAG: hypothetical protein QOI82_986 [Actinomycetota bacterium]|jgi:hypothetical protein|nr:hypothetical protein [Actinomycetota bacterium]